jgi:hypothetical protein
MTCSTAIGSEHYLSSVAAGATRFPHIRGAVASARRISGLLARAGARFGVVLESDPKHLLREAEFWFALDRVTRAIWRSKAAHPLFVFTFAGHGISEGTAWNQFLVPGNRQGPSGPLRATDLANLPAFAILAAELVERTRQRGGPCGWRREDPAGWSCARGGVQSMTSCSSRLVSASRPASMRAMNSCRALARCGCACDIAPRRSLVS